MESICSNKKAKCEQFKTDICSKLLLNNYCYYSSEYIFFVPNSSCAAEISPKHTDSALIIFKTGGEVKKWYCTKTIVYEVVTSLTSREVLKQYWLVLQVAFFVPDNGQSSWTLNTYCQVKSRNPLAPRVLIYFQVPVTFQPLKSTIFQCNFLIFFLSSEQFITDRTSEVFLPRCAAFQSLETTGFTSLAQ